MTPYPADFGGYVIGALPYAGLTALHVFMWCVVFVAPAALGWWLLGKARRRARLGDLMDRGDGQGGIPPIARRLAQADARTEAISMRDIVVRPQLEDTCPQFCDNLAEVGDPADCGCGGPCGRAWCPRLRNPVPVTWTEREEGVR